MDTANRKRQVRAQLLQERKALSRIDCQAKSRKIAERLLASPAFSAASVVHCYLSDVTEVQTDEIIEEALHRGKRVVVPVISQGRLTLSEIRDLHPAHFQPGPFGIREPIPDFQREIKKENIDLFILPAVAYDIMGHRLGRGGGYYDRLLAGLAGKIIGLAFEFQCAASLPFEETDRRVDMIITENRAIICGRESA